jgi:hypothetical protein
MQIIAVRYGSRITTDPGEIVARYKYCGQLPDEYIRRERAQLMVYFDCGDHWRRLAESPTLFEVDAQPAPESGS